MSTKQITKIGILSAFALVIFIIESAIPPLIPIPGVKLGISNIFILYSIIAMNPTDGLFILIIKIVLGNILSGQMISFSYSLVGGILCFISMLLASYILKKQQIWFISEIGAIFHSIGQIAVAIVMVKSFSVLYYLPMLIACSIVSGTFTGLACQQFINKAY